MADTIIPINVADALQKYDETGDASALQSVINDLVAGVNEGTGGGGGNVSVDTTRGIVMDMDNDDVLFYLYRYLHVRFSTDQSGTGFVADTADLSGSPTVIYIGVANSASTTAPTSAASYTWNPFTWASGRSVYYSAVGGRHVEFSTAASLPPAPFRPYTVVATGIDLDNITSTITIGSSPESGAPSSTDIGFTANEDLVAIADRGGGFFYTYGLAAANASDNPYSFAQYQTDNFSVLPPGDRMVGNDAVEDGINLAVGYEVDHTSSDPAILEIYRSVTPPSGQQAALLDRNWTFNFHTGQFRRGNTNSEIWATNIEGTTIDAQNRLTHLLGERLATPIQFESYVHNISASPSAQTVNWDALPGNVTFTATNNSNFQTEYASQVTRATRGSTNLTVSDTADSSFVATNTYTLTQNSAEGTNQYDGRDIRTGSVSSAGGTQTLTVHWRTNQSASDLGTASSTFGWRAAPTMAVSNNIGNQNFDAVNTSYTVTTSFSNLSADGTVGSQTVTPNSGLGSAQTQASPGRSRTYTFSGVSIYHDTTVAGSITGSLIRPTSVSAESLSNRTLTRNGSWSRTPTTVYKWWGITSTTSNDTFNIASDLGTLSNSGYATAATGTSTSTTAWRSSTFTSGTADSTPDTFFLVVPRPGSETITFQNPTTNFTIVPNGSTDITLGQSGHLVNYRVYTFTVPANNSLSMRVVVS